MERPHQVSPLLDRITVSTASTSEILPMNAVVPNSSYAISYRGPSLKCGPASTQKIDDRLSPAAAIGYLVNATSFKLGGQFDGSLGSQGFPIYLAVTPDRSRAVLTSEHEDPNIKLWTQIAADCVVGVRPCTILQNRVYKDVLWVRQGNDSITCALHETNYHLSFETTGNTRRITAMEYELQGQIENSSTPYLPVAQSVVNLLTGTLGLITGTDVGCQVNCHNITSMVSYRTRIWSTALIGALNLTEGVPFWIDPLSPIPDIPPEDRALTRGLTLSPLIEELSRNVTLSLFSDPRFQYVRFPQHRLCPLTLIKQRKRGLYYQRYHSLIRKRLSLRFT